MKLLKINWKTITCPKCWSNIYEKDITNYESSNNYLKLTCPYCWTNFIWTYESLKSPKSWIYVWYEYNFLNKKYKITWWVQYSIEWIEKKLFWDDIWTWSYIEWTARSQEWDLIYISEYHDYEESTYEISKKIIPNFNITNISDEFIEIDNKKYYFKEIWDCSVLKVYWEVVKSYTIWEKIKLFYFTYNGKNYILEKEWSENNQEVWFYEILKRFNFWYFNKDLLSDIEYKISQLESKLKRNFFENIYLHFLKLTRNIIIFFIFILFTFIFWYFIYIGINLIIVLFSFIINLSLNLYLETLDYWYNLINKTKLIEEFKTNMGLKIEKYEIIY